MSDIQELEAKLVQSQKKLNDLQYEVNAIHMELVKLKAENPQPQVAQQTQANPQPQHQFIPDAPAMNPNMDQMVSNVQAGNQPNVQQSAPNTQKYWESEMPFKNKARVPAGNAPASNGPYRNTPAGNGPYRNVPAGNGPYRNASPAPQKARDTEILVGIKGMGIVASILVFISFILFAMYLIPGLTDTVKMTLMFVISGVLTFVGLFFWLRKKESMFFLSLGGCGIGAIYISLFVTHLYFHMIDQIPLYILLLVWAAGVLFLSRIKPILFEIIGLSGIIISVFLGTVSCVTYNDGMMLGVLAIYLVVGVLAFMLLKLNDNISLIISNVAACLGSACIALASFDISDDVILSSLVLVIFTMVLIVLTLIFVNESRYHYLPVFGAIYTGVLLLAINAAIPDDDLYSLIAIIISVILYIGVELYHKLEISGRAPAGAGKSVGIIVWEVVLLIAATSNLLDYKILCDTVGAFVLLIPLLVYGFISDDKQSKISALVLYVFVIFNFEVNPWAGLFYVIAVFALFVVMMALNKNQYDKILKLLFYIVFMLGLHAQYIALVIEQEWDDEISASVLMLIAGVINFAALKTKFGRNWLTDDEEKGIRITTYVINACLMLESICLMNFLSDSVDYAFAKKTFVVLIAIFLFMINAARFLKSENAPAVVYVGLKFTVLLIVILNAFDAVNYVISISVFLLATGIILLGFKLKLKSLRIYGLVTTMIFAVKLVMFDIKYDNVLGNALSFFISGIICFGISALYSIADKKLSAGENGGNDSNGGVYQGMPNDPNGGVYQGMPNDPNGGVYQGMPSDPNGSIYQAAPDQSSGYTNE